MYPRVYIYRENTACSLKVLLQSEPLEILQIISIWKGMVIITDSQQPIVILQDI